MPLHSLSFYQVLLMTMCVDECLSPVSFPLQLPGHLGAVALDILPLSSTFHLIPSTLCLRFTALPVTLLRLIREVSLSCAYSLEEHH